MATKWKIILYKAVVKIEEALIFYRPHISHSREDLRARE
jgi:hypothetical protein